MTFISPARLSGPFTDLIRPLTAPRPVTAAPQRIRLADEDGARKALGTDGLTSPTLLSGSSLEHLARVAFG